MHDPANDNFILPNKKLSEVFPKRIRIKEIASVIKQHTTEQPANLNKVSHLVTEREVSPVLAEFLGKPQATFGEVHKKVMAYASEKGLFDKNDKHLIHFDAKLTQVFGDLKAVRRMEFTREIWKHLRNQSSQTKTESTKPRQKFREASTKISEELEKLAEERAKNADLRAKKLKAREKDRARRSKSEKATPETVESASSVTKAPEASAKTETAQTDEKVQKEISIKSEEAPAEKIQSKSVEPAKAKSAEDKPKRRPKKEKAQKDVKA